MINQRLSLTKALEELGEDRRNFYRRLARGNEASLSASVEQLRVSQMEMMEDELLEIADDPSIKDREKYYMLDTRKWILGRRVDRFREKKDITTAGKPILVSDL